jgi:hypothetical protein
MHPLVIRFKYALVAILLSSPAAGLLAGPDLVKNGVIDLRTADLTSTRIPLTGQWLYFENQLLQPGNIPSRGVFADFPGAWNDVRPDRSGSGFATYSVTILPPPAIRNLALELPQVYSSYSLWLNGKLLASNGTVGTTDESTIAQWMPQTVSFDNPGDTIHLVLQIANFHHYKGGIKDPIYLGSGELLQHHRSISVVSNEIESSLLALIAVGFLFVYFLKEQKQVILYFALLCLTWSVRVGFSNLYIFISMMPDFSWTAMIRIEYCTLFLTMIWAILFLSGMFPKEQFRVVKYVLVVANVFFIAFALLAHPISFTEWIPVYLGCCAIVLIYGTVLVLRAWINQRAGATFLTISILLGVFVFAYDVFAYEGFSAYNPVIFSAGYATIFSLMSVVLLVHLEIIKTKSKSISKLTYKDLYK